MKERKRRRWTEQEKLNILAEARNSSIYRVSLVHAIPMTLLFRWRKKLIAVDNDIPI